MKQINDMFDKCDPKHIERYGEQGVKIRMLLGEYLVPRALKNEPPFNNLPYRSDLAVFIDHMAMIHEPVTAELIESYIQAYKFDVGDEIYRNQPLFDEIIALEEKWSLSRQRDYDADMRKIASLDVKEQRQVCKDYIKGHRHDFKQTKASDRNAVAFACAKDKHTFVLELDFGSYGSGEITPFFVIKEIPYKRRLGDLLAIRKKSWYFISLPEVNTVLTEILELFDILLPYVLNLIDEQDMSRL